MPPKQPTLQIQRSLYDVAGRVRELAPWEWMEEVDVFGVQHPTTGQMGFISVMGMLGEHFAVAVYVGSEGLYGFWRLQELGPTLGPEAVLEIPQIQASFEDRNYLEKEDRDVIKKLGLKFRGANAWPMFRSYRPGYFPWHIEADEASLLLVALEQLLDVAPRFKADEDLLYPTDDDELLVRVPRASNGETIWEDKIMAIDPSPLLEFDIPLDERLLDDLKQRTPRQGHLEVDLFMYPAPVQDKKGGRPYFPYMLMLVDADSGFIYGSELLRPIPSLHDMWGLIPPTALKQLRKLKFLPQEISARSPLVYGMLTPLAKFLGFRMKQTTDLPALDAARESLNRFGGIMPH